MSRTTPALVKGILLRDYDTKKAPDLQPFIDSAGLLVDRTEAYALSIDAPLLDPELEMLERWLAAHYYKQSDQAFASKGTDGATASFQGQTGKSLESTKYGQTAITLDYSGYLGLVTTGAGPTLVGGVWLGRTTETPWDQRGG